MNFYHRSLNIAELFVRYNRSPRKCDELSTKTKQNLIKMTGFY